MDTFGQDEPFLPKLISGHGEMTHRNYTPLSSPLKSQMVFFFSHLKGLKMSKFMSP